MRRIAFLLPLLIAIPIFAALTPEQQRANLESFDKVWSTVQEKHWDPKMGGLDWQAVRAELRPKVESAQSEAEVREIIGEMLARLHESHNAVIPGDVYHDLANPVKAADDAPVSAAPAAGEEDGTPGIDIRVIDQEAVVVEVEPKSPAARQGVRPGWTIKAINDENLAPALTRTAGTYAKSTMRDMMLSRVVLSRLWGPAGNPVDIEFRDGHDKRVLLSLDREAFRGTPSKFGYLPEEHVWIESKRIGNDVEYIRFNLFLDPAHLVPAFQDAVRSCMSCAGIVIDLRGNPGGIGLLATGIAGYFVAQPDERLGTMQMRELPLKFVVNPRPPVFPGKVAVLIDGLSASTSEIFAGGMQDLGRARIFGTRSAGAALPSMIERLPNGDAFQFAAASYTSQSGKVLEGAGVTPDETKPLTRAALLAGKDPALDAAVDWIRQGARASMNTKGITQ